MVKSSYSHAWFLDLWRESRSNCHNLLSRSQSTMWPSMGSVEKMNKNIPHIYQNNSKKRYSPKSLTCEDYNSFQGQLLSRQSLAVHWITVQKLPSDLSILMSVQTILTCNIRLCLKTFQNISMEKIPFRWRWRFTWILFSLPIQQCFFTRFLVHFSSAFLSLKCHFVQKTVILLCESFIQNKRWVLLFTWHLYALWIYSLSIISRTLIHFKITWNYLIFSTKGSNKLKICLL